MSRSGDFCVDDNKNSNKMTEPITLPLAHVRRVITLKKKKKKKFPGLCEALWAKIFIPACRMGQN